MPCDFSQIVCSIYLFAISNCLLESFHKHIWAMFACSQSRTVLFRKWKGLVKFWSLLFGICDWAPSVEFIPSNVSHFSKTRPVQSMAQPTWGLQLSVATQNLSREVSMCTSQTGVINLEPGNILFLLMVLSLSKIFAKVHLFIWRNTVLLVLLNARIF